MRKFGDRNNGTTKQGAGKNLQLFLDKVRYLFLADLKVYLGKANSFVSPQLEVENGSLLTYAALVFMVLKRCIRRRQRRGSVAERSKALV